MTKTRAHAERRRRAAAVFVDRDGVLIRDVNYLRRPEQVRLLKGSAEAVRDLRRAGFKVVCITNQSGVGRGYLTLSTLKKAHARLSTDLRRAGGPGARLDGLYFCPHLPGDGCRCRKPKPGMIEAAARALKLDVSRSWFVGDTTADMACAAAAGCAGAVLVRTGKGGRDGKHAAKPAHRARSLATAARWILKKRR